MSDLIKSGLSWLTDQLTAHASQTVTYTAGVESGDVSATLGRKLLKLTDQFGVVRYEHTDMTFWIPASDMDFGSGFTEPERGHFVSRVIGGQTETYEVTPYGTEPCWMWDDPNHTLLRVHTKLKSIT